MRIVPEHRQPIKIDNDFARIPLTQGKFAAINTDDIPRVNMFSWALYNHKGSRGFYAKGRCPAIKIPVFLHRLLMNFPLLHCDHIDGDGLNNCRYNLRLSTQQQNNWNTPSRGGASKYKGVYRYKRRAWVAQIRINYKLHTLGIFADEIDAAIAYDRAAVKAFGKFARCNFGDFPATMS